MGNQENQDIKAEKSTPPECDETQELVTESLSEGNGAGEGEESEFKKRYFYLAAEMDNLTKRFQREKEGIIKFSNEKLLIDLLDVMDNFDRTISAIGLDSDPKVKNITVGIQMVRLQFVEVLKRYGLAEIEAIGKKFDPNFHDAVAKRFEEGKEDDEILEEYQKGYLLNGRLIRAARVAVCSVESH